MKADDEHHIMFVLGQIMDESRRILLEQGEGRLRPSQYRVISRVPPEGGITVTDLADRVGMTKQGVGQFVTQLAGDGYLAIDIDADDRRVRVVRRTTLGEEAMRELTVQLRGLEARWSRRVGARRYREFRAVLDELAGLGRTPADRR
jgi:DNA-binding MarR family transcriptional regulator